MAGASLSKLPSLHQHCDTQFAPFSLVTSFTSVHLRVLLRSFSTFTITSLAPEQTLPFPLLPSGYPPHLSSYHTHQPWLATLTLPTVVPLRLSLQSMGLPLTTALSPTLQHLPALFLLLDRLLSLDHRIILASRLSIIPIPLVNPRTTVIFLMVMLLSLVTVLLLRSSKRSRPRSECSDRMDHTRPPEIPDIGSCSVLLSVILG